MADTSLLGKILLADDEETYLEATTDLLRREGYECASVSDGARGRRLLAAGRYDLLIADIKMPGNSELELIRDLPKVARGMPAILVTGYPSLSTAIDSVELSVVAYLVKPIDFDELLAAVRRGIGISRAYRTVAEARDRNQDTLSSLEVVERALQDKSLGANEESLQSFVDLTLSNILAGLRDLKHLTDDGMLQPNPLEARRRESEARLETVKQVLGEAVVTLDKTRSAFKSRTIGALREQLEEVLAQL